jgi:hypothetical protein
MSKVTRIGLVVFAIAALVSGAACSKPAPHDVPPPAPPPALVGAGIQQNVSLASFQGQGWSVCHEERYSERGTPVATVLSGCAGQYLMLACRADTSTDTLALAAADTRAVVTQVDPEGVTSFHASHGVGWYFTESMSWGFFPASDTVNRANCDLDGGTQTSKDQRLCWNVLDGALLRGWRCGDNVLDSSSGSGSTFRRMVLAHP